MLKKLLEYLVIPPVAHFQSLLLNDRGDDKDYDVLVLDADNDRLQDMDELLNDLNL
jgi:hypothetical protein